MWLLEGLLLRTTLIDAVKGSNGQYIFVLLCAIGCTVYRLCD